MFDCINLIIVQCPRQTKYQYSSCQTWKRQWYNKLNINAAGKEDQLNNQSCLIINLIKQFLKISNKPQQTVKAFL